MDKQKCERLRDRAALFKKARAFFDERQMIEVDCPLLSPRASVDAHIDLIPATYNGNETRYLHSSPEYGMKRLIAAGMGDIYQLSHVFRDGEWGARHNPEFTMAEWYRCSFSLEQMIAETVDFIRLFLGPLPYRILHYRSLVQQETGLDCVTASEEQLLNYLQTQGIPFYPSVKEEGKDALLNLILGAVIEPKLGHEQLDVLAYYPATQAALARKQWHGDACVAERFEIYYRGIELANGYHELADSAEQRLRLIEANAQRLALKKSPLPIDELFLKALEEGLPDCCGVAVGFDRLMMLRHRADNLAAILAWDWGMA